MEMIKKMPDRFYHWQLDEFIRFGRLPLYVEHVPRGEHPVRHFHDHNCFETVIVLNGHASHLVDYSNVTPNIKQISSPIKTGDILVLHPGTIHGYDHVEDLEIINIVYDRSTLAMPTLDGYALPAFRRIFPADDESPAEFTATPILSLSSSELAKIIPVVRRLQNVLAEFQPGCMFESLTLFMELILTLTHFAPEEEKKDKTQTQFLIGNAVRFMNGNYMRQISLDQMAQAANMSRRNFSRHFRAMTGMSAAEYLLRLRLNRAQELLVETDLSIGDIGEKCGFYDGNYFCRKFREHLSVTPGTFRQQTINSR